MVLFAPAFPLAAAICYVTFLVELKVFASPSMPFNAYLVKVRGFIQAQSDRAVIVIADSVEEDVREELVRCQT